MRKVTWTQAGFMRSLLHTARLDSTHFRAVELDTSECSNKSEWNEKKLRRTLTVFVDPSQDGYVYGAIHELMHYVLRDLRYYFCQELEEDVVKGLDKWVKRYLDDRPNLMKTWRRLIIKRLKGAS